MKKVRVNLGSNSYDVLIGSGLLARAGEYLKEIGFKDKVVIITDARVKDLYGTSLEGNLTGDGFRVSLIEVPEGEGQKSLETAGRLYQELTNFYVERTTPVLALGGGVIGDLVGFVAATYLRGVPLIQMPTTLLSQVDSSIGGKVAVNYGSLKNRIGAFYQPKLVLTDIQALKTLGTREISDGLAEVIKYALIWDREFFTYLEENIDRIKSLDEQALEFIVARSVEIKALVVEKDERDTGLRNILNFGHTLGHAIESASNFQVLHGEGVAIGMVFAAIVSNKLGMLGQDEVARLRNLVSRAGLPIGLRDLEVPALLKAMKHDKKIIQDKIRFVLLKSIGSVSLSDEVSFSLLEGALNEFRQKA